MAIFSAGPSWATGIRLTPPGLRPINDPSIIIPASTPYTNRTLHLPQYRETSGQPASGWSTIFVETRRFASDQSAWIFFREADVRHITISPRDGVTGDLRLWPVGSFLVIESYKGNALNPGDAQLIEIATMSKPHEDNMAENSAFYPANWSYARFDAAGNLSVTPTKVRQCHQCHSIAFHLNGDSVFSVFP